MKSAKNLFIVGGAFSLAILLFALAAPKAAHAIVATLVQITNTASSPVPTWRTDNDGRNVVRLFYGETMPDGTTASAGQGLGNPLLDGSNFQVYTVPAGKRLVVDSVSAFAYPPPGQNVFEYLYNGTPAGGFGTFTGVPLVSQGTWNGTTYYQNAIPIHDYVDQNQQYQVSMSRSSGTGSMFWDVQVVGHLVDCTNGGGC
jgi:hypothetical protein